MGIDRGSHAAISMAAPEGWNPGLDDAERFLAADPDSFLATEREGETVATVSCVLYGDSYAFIGFYIVRSDLRGRGIGSPLFERALRRAGGRVVGLDGCRPGARRVSGVASCWHTATSAGARWAVASASPSSSRSPSFRSASSA